MIDKFQNNTQMKSLVMLFTDQTAPNHRLGFNTAKDHPFELVRPEDYCNWARTESVRYYADVSLPSDAVLRKTGYGEFQADKIILGDLKDIWTHPNFHMEYYLAEKLAIILVDRNASDIQYIPTKFLTFDLVRRAIDGGCSLSSIPTLTKSIVDYALKKNMMNYMSVPQEFVTEEMTNSWDQYCTRRLRQGP